MRFKVIESLFFIVLIVLFIAETTVLHASIYSVERNRHMIIVAVNRAENGTYGGVSADLYVNVACPGNGHVYVETAPLSELDTQASARVAAMVASTVANTSFNACDYFVSIKANTSIIGGPSASAAVAVAFTASLLDIPLDESVVITGMIMPDGSIGPVGGLPEKLEAAAGRGAKVFLIPYGQEIAVDYVVEEEQGTGYSGQVVKQVQVNLTELGSKLGVRVIPVSTIYEALEVATNRVFRSPLIINITDILGKYMDYIKPVLNKWITDEVSDINNTMRETEYKLGKTSLPIDLRDFVDEAKNEINSTISTAEKYENQGLLYAASSKYFQALIYSKWLKYVVELYVNESSFNYILHGLNDSAQLLLELIGIHASVESMDINNLSVLVGSTSRVFEALMYLDNAVSSWRNNDLITTAYYLGYAEARLKTAHMWMSLRDYLKNTMNYSITLEELKQVALSIATLARDTVNYVYTLTTSSQQDLHEAMTWVDKAMTEENTISKLALAIEAYGTAYNVLIYSLTGNYLNAVAKSLLKSSDYLITSLYSANVLPVSVILYRELAQAYMDSPESLCYALARLNTEMFTYLFILRLVSTQPSNTPSPLTQTSTPVINQTHQSTTTVVTTITVTMTLQPHNIVVILLVTVIITGLIAVLLALVMLSLRKRATQSVT